MRVAKLTKEIGIPEKVEVSAEGRTITVKGPKGETKREFNFPKLNANTEGNKVVLTVENATRREKTQLGTMEAHVKNMIMGVVEGHVYKLKICSGHFPMNVSVSGDTFVIKNFLGEKVPRTLKIKEGTKVNVEGTEVTVESVDKEKAGQVAADIEQLTRITNRDVRIFQDGIYITGKSKRALQ